MKMHRKASPARSEGHARSSIRHKPRRTLSSSASVISAVSQERKNNTSFVVSPLGNRKSILSDNTEIEEPRRKSWWKNLDEHSTTSRDIMVELEKNENVEPRNIIEEIDMEILSQENKKKYSLELPESSDNESIHSIIITQKNLLKRKENQKQKYFAQIAEHREPLAKHETGVDKTLVTGTKELFQNKQRSRPLFPADLLKISPNKTAAEKTKDFATAEPRAQNRNIFGHHNKKRKNIFTNFIITESEDEISEIQPKVFGFQKTTEASRHSSLRGIREPSPAFSLTADMEMDDWLMLPSSTMVENQLDVPMTVQTSKRARLSNLAEMESEVGSNTTEHSNKSNSSKNDKSRKSKTFTKEKANDLEKIEENDNDRAENIDKSRKSKTFTKEKACEHETDYEMIDKSTSLLNENENLDKSTKDTSKSRKSKTFTKEIVNLEKPKKTPNKSRVHQDDEIENKSLTKISEHNTSMKVKNQKNTLPNNSQFIEEADSKSHTRNKNKTISNSKVIENIQEINPDENNDEELNFSLHYENDSNDEEPEIQNKSMTSQKEIKNKDKGMASKVVEESAKVESSQDKNISKGDNIVTNHDHGDQYELEQKSLIKSKDVSQDLENKNVQNNKHEVAPDELDNADTLSKDIEEENSEQNESQVASNHESDNEEEMGEQNESLVASDHESDNEEENGEQNESQFASNHESDNEEENGEENESLVANDHESDNEEENGEQNENLVASDHESDNEEETDEQNESQFASNHESDNEENESLVANDHESDNEEENGEQNETQVASNNHESDNEEENGEQNATEHESNNEEENSEQIESRVADKIDIESDDEDEQDHYESQMQNESDVEQNESQVQKEITESPNISHDTTGRNRKKNTSLEAVRHGQTNFNNSNSYSVKTDKTLRKTEMLKSIHPDLIARESAEFFDGSTSSAQGSGWDSHRTTRKTLRQTFGRDFTPRKSLRALVMEKSVKRQTHQNEMASVSTHLFSKANSTEMPLTRFDDENDNEDIPPNDVSLRTRQTTIEKYLMGVAKINTERRKKIEEKVNSYMKEPPNLKKFKIPQTPLYSLNAPPKPKHSKSAKRAAKLTEMFGDLPPEIVKDLTYKPPKRFRPRDAEWATKYLYQFLEKQLEPKYNYKSRVRAERLVEHLYNFTKDLNRRTVASPDAVDVLKREMARLHIVKTHDDFYQFFHDFMPKHVQRMVIPNVVNKIALPRQGVFSDIL